MATGFRRAQPLRRDVAGCWRCQFVDRRRCGHAASPSGSPGAALIDVGPGATPIVLRVQGGPSAVGRRCAFRFPAFASRLPKGPFHPAIFAGIAVDARYLLGIGRNQASLTGKRPRGTAVRLWQGPPAATANRQPLLITLDELDCWCGMLLPKLVKVGTIEGLAWLRSQAERRGPGMVAATGTRPGSAA